MPRATSLEKNLMLGKVEGERKRLKVKGGTEPQRMRWVAGVTSWTWIWANSGRWWRTGNPGVLRSVELQSQTRLSDWTTRLFQSSCHNVSHTCAETRLVRKDENTGSGFSCDWERTKLRRFVSILPEVSWYSLGLWFAQQCLDLITGVFRSWVSRLGSGALAFLPGAGCLRWQLLLVWEGGPWVT